MFIDRSSIHLARGTSRNMSCIKTRNSAPRSEYDRRPGVELLAPITATPTSSNLDGRSISECNSEFLNHLLASKINASELCKYLKHHFSLSLFTSFFAMASTPLRKRDESPSTSEKGDPHVPPPDQVYMSTNRARLVWAGVLPAAIVIGLTAGMATLILVWLRVWQYADPSTGYRPGFVHAITHGKFTLDEGYKFSDGKRGANGLVAKMRVLTFSVVAASNPFHLTEACIYEYFRVILLLR